MFKRILARKRLRQSPELALRANLMHETLLSAVPMTNKPELASEAVMQWIEEIQTGSVATSSTFTRLSEDISGILLAAHKVDPHRFAVTLAVDAMAISTVLQPSLPRPASAAYAWWRQYDVIEHDQVQVR